MMMNPEKLYERYQELQAYVGWEPADGRRVQVAGPLVVSVLDALVDDFYAEVARHPGAMKVMTGGADQIARLKVTLRTWLKELFSGCYDADYVTRRWRVGWRHVEIGLDQVYTNVALSRLRRGLVRTLEVGWSGTHEELQATLRSLNTLLDLDLAIIEDAYQAEYLARQQRSERLAAIGQVAGGVAHELRNPLNVVKTSIYYLRNARNLLPAKRDEHLERIERHVVLADGVITALSNFARMPVPAQVRFSVAQCVAEALETNPLPPEVKVELDWAAELPPALADPDQMRIVFANLIRNAREAMPQGGQLSIRGRPNDTGDEPGVAVEVSDTGVGIPSEMLSQVMEPLYSTKARGLGLGLAITRAILEKNQGSIRVHSEVGKGSTFTVTLRAAGSDGASAESRMSS